LTTIAYRDGIMASDSGSWGNATHGWAKKLAKGKDGILYGVTGNAAECDAFLSWVNSGYEGEQPVAEKEDENCSSFCVLIAEKDKPIRYRTSRGDETYDAPYYAVGSSVAWGALYAGSTAIVAIEAAREHGSSCVGKVQTISHD